MTNVVNPTHPLDDDAGPVTSVDQLRRRISGAVLTAGDVGFAEATLAWNRADRHQPLVVVEAADVDDVILAVRFAAHAGIGLGVQTTGHGMVRPADGGVLLSTRRFDAVRVDPVARTAWVGGGCTWGPVLDAAQEHGLAPVLGSAPHVGAVGYVLGGGVGWLARKHGTGADSVRSFEVVTPDGRLVRASAEENVELFRALRGGGGGLGVVVGMEVELHPVTTVYAGNLLYGPEQAEAVVAAWADLVADAPDELTSEVVFMNFPPIPDVPEPIRGRSFTIVRGCWAGDLAEGRAFVDRLRATIPPIVDMWDEMPFSAMAAISNDPVDPLPSLGTGGWLDRLDADVVRAFASATFPTAGPPVLMFSEIRHVGGATARGDRRTTVLGNREGTLLWHALGVPMDAEMPRAIAATLDALRARLAGADSDHRYLNFVAGEERRASRSAAVGEGDEAAIAELKGRLDPEDVLRFGVAG
jgi:hypothetical protein